MAKYFTTADAAQYLGVTAARIRQFIMNSRLESEKRGRDHLILESELERFARETKRKSGRPKKNK